MKKTNANIVVEEIIKMLNKAYSEEWYEYHEKNTGSKIEGPLKEKVKAEMLFQSDQDFNHASVLSKRIEELGGKPSLIAMDQLYCGNRNPLSTDDPYVEIILNEKLKRKCYAIQKYKAILEFTKDRDGITHLLIRSILDDELRHERIIEQFIIEIYQLKEDIISHISRFMKDTKVSGLVHSEA